MKEILIRPVEMADLAAILEIETLNFPDLAADSLVIENRIEQIRDTFYVIFYQGKLVAYAEGSVIDLDTPLTPLFARLAKNRPSGGYIFLTSVSVHPDFQGQGFGTMLLATFKDLSIEKGRRGIFLLCKEDKISFYQMNGFLFRGLSDSNFGGESWMEMIWENPVIDKQNENSTSTD